MKDLLNSISVLSTFSLSVLICFYALNFTVGRMKFFHKNYRLYKVIDTDIVFIGISVITILALVFTNVLKFYKPW